MCHRILTVQGRCIAYETSQSDDSLMSWKRGMPAQPLCIESHVIQSGMKCSLCSASLCTHLAIT